MNAFIHRSEKRGHVNIDWLDSKHSFSFGSWYDPNYMGVSVLRVINDDRIAAQNGYFLRASPRKSRSDADVRSHTVSRW